MSQAMEYEWEDSDPPEPWDDGDDWPGPGARSNRFDELRGMPVGELNLSLRARVCLKRSGITTVGQIMDLSPNDLLALRNFGMKSLREVWDRLIDVTAPHEEPNL